jgi:hypothetical protein
MMHNHNNDKDILAIDIKMDQTGVQFRRFQHDGRRQTDVFCLVGLCGDHSC